MVRAQETPVCQIHEVLPGMRVTADRASLSSSLAWSPWKFTRQARSLPVREEAVATLRRRIIACTDAWASQARHTLLAVSGGLDSSIVAAALAASGRSFTCLTLYTGQAAGDERPYARQMARTSASIKEEPERVDFVDLERSEARHLPRPISRAFAQSGDRAHQELAARLGADQFMTGGAAIMCSASSIR
jgi:asparagine synthase (glutamine-hydrolysing)